MPATDASYANILKKNVNLIVKPKNNDQPHAATRLKMRQSVDPVTNNIKFSQVKNIKNGGLLIKCDGSEDASKLKELASLHLADDYEVKEVRKFNPRLKIVGMSECIDKEQLSVILKSQNSVFQNDSECTVLKVWPTKKSGDVFQAILDVDIATYSSILSRGNLIVNFESCIVYDAISLRLCFKCCGHNHYAKNCKSKVQVCVKCSLDHKLSECRSASLKCINCVNARLPNSNHAAWDADNCTLYMKKLAEYKKSIIGDI
ncbi:unnamed protein product [Acanthoscelides obtectus]|uniref:Gag-like protein n=1 Tax=Acanthoscelides obtectus TaxID=200917 RepID=A0A9P0PA34_ACAOB|nr:unnamed protein product [Acanthoscelides obtectus]CAK1671677.1 hypothetical protein AOBTE_LOCUS28397 [Acanthoscelides obtectus]